jgi:hypothetical protein
MTTNFIGTLITQTQPNVSIVGNLDSLNVVGISTFSDFYSSGVITFDSCNSSYLQLNNYNMGLNAGSSNQKTNAIAIGNSSGFNNQGSNSISIGLEAGYINQGANSIAIGYLAGETNQASNSIAIGYLAGSINQAQNSCVISALGSIVTGSSTGATYIAPIRNISQSSTLGYNTSTNEISIMNINSGSSTIEKVRINIGANIANYSFNTQSFIAWNGSSQGSITGFSNNTSNGIITLNNTGLYFLYPFIRTISTVTTGQRSIYFYNSLDTGHPITASASTSKFFSANQYLFSLTSNISTSYAIYVQTAPITLAIGFFQNTSSTMTLDAQTNLSVVRMA